MEFRELIIDAAYLTAAIFFITGLKALQSPATARRGNTLAGIGMLIAVVATLFLKRILSPAEMIIGLAVGGLIGAVLARRVKMTSMPELVAAFNGFGGLSSALVASAELFGLSGGVTPENFRALISIPLSVLIGVVTFSGSFIAFGKLSGKISGNPVSFKGQQLVLFLLFALSIASMVWVFVGTDSLSLGMGPALFGVVALSLFALILGVVFVLPIGGADMPVVVALLNAFSGLAAAMTGFVLSNTALVVSGALVGASGLILTNIMCVAMNRSILNVLVGNFGGDADDSSSGVKVTASRPFTRTTPDDTAILLSYAEKVIIIPGYGLAVAQAQHQVRELSDLLQSRGVEVKFAIHPVAGRMPGHMNVLLAEANVPYDQLFEMDEINHEFESSDVTLVIGANDVVNPAARSDKSSPIYGMPILNADQSRATVVLKRSMRPGYAGVQNNLFFAQNTRMLFGDAKDSVAELISEVKEV